MSTPAPPRHVSCVAPINIAIVKYWGKIPTQEGTTLILPLNDSLSVTLSCNILRTRTEVTVSSDFMEDIMILNGKEVSINKRIRAMLDLVRGSGAPKDLCIRIVTENNFPTAAGMASSASGCAALAFALTKIFPEATVDPTILARIGSGSACRSVYGGFVQWIASTESDSCIARVVAPQSHWPEMSVLCLVTGVHEKDVSSTDGMQLSVQTSPMMEPRIRVIAPRRIQALTRAIHARDFAAFAQIAMDDSDDFHSICYTSVPRITYLTQQSFDIIRLVKGYNEVRGSVQLGYSFDAGPNAFLFTPRDNLVEVLALVLRRFPGTPEEKFLLEKDVVNLEKVKKFQLSPRVGGLVEESHATAREQLSLVFQSSVGAGPALI